MGFMAIWFMAKEGHAVEAEDGDAFVLAFDSSPRARTGLYDIPEKRFSVDCQLGGQECKSIETQIWSCQGQHNEERKKQNGNERKCGSDKSQRDVFFKVKTLNVQNGVILYIKNIIIKAVSGYNRQTPL